MGAWGGSRLPAAVTLSGQLSLAPDDDTEEVVFQMPVLSSTSWRACGFMLACPPCFEFVEQSMALIVGSAGLSELDTRSDNAESRGQGGKNLHFFLVFMEK